MVDGTTLEMLSKRFYSFFSVEGLSLLKDVTGVTLIPLFERPAESNSLQKLSLSCRKVLGDSFITNIQVIVTVIRTIKYITQIVRFHFRISSE